jgi:leucyl aminopeptidase (aminopeptidase T)
MFDYAYEVAKAADLLISKLMGASESETVILTADTGSDMRAVDATAAAAYQKGAKPVVVSHICPATMGKSADPILPVEALSAILKEADVWVEFDSSGLMYTTPYDVATYENKKLRHIAMGTADVDMLVRCIGRVDFDVMAQFERELLGVLQRGMKMHVTTLAGTDVFFEQDPKNPFLGSEKLYDEVLVPGSYTLPGTIAWAPKLETVTGTIVFDGGIGVPALNLGVLRSPIILQVEVGSIVSFDGGAEAKLLESYLRSFNDPQTLRLAHTGIGYNPGAITRARFGNMLEDERIWGATHWGIGEISNTLIPGGQRPAPMHCDGTCLRSTLYVDGTEVVREGEFIIEELFQLASKLKQMVI